MRATSSNTSQRQGKRRLLGSCALAAGMVALAFGGPALAQVQGTGQVTLGSATISPPSPGAPANTTQVTTTTTQTVINWTPTDTATTGGAIDFLPVGNNLEFYGSGDYTVLNRFVGRDALGNPIPISRQVGLNGAVNSFIGTPFSTSGNVQGGNIWFYNAGGILIGGTAVINVGSLLLTANDIDTTGGLFSNSNQIRFRGVSGSTSAVTISSGASINASKANPGSSYVALVAPRIVQAGTINTDGSTALVAAEQADIRINNGLFDINVSVGAEGGDVITHTGVTSGPAHQQGDNNDNRVYLVAIPKNDAVTMLVAGQLGYRDALVAQTDADGGIVLSAGYNISNGQTDFVPANGTAANITIADTLFLSNTNARASGALVAAPLSTVPAPGGTFVPPPQLGRIAVQGDGNFVGDASASLTVGTGQIVGATGDLTVSASGTSSAPGTATVTATGGQLVALGDLTVSASGPILADGSSNAGTAILNVSGGTVSAINVDVTASTTGGIGSGVGGNATGGNASITVTGSGLLTADMITARANAVGGGLFLGQSFETLAVDNGGNGTGGTATISVINGGTLTANDVVAAEANGQGQTGNILSGDGFGGTARIEVSGSGSTIDTPITQVTATGMGGANFPRVFIGALPTLFGGDGTGGNVTIALDGDDSVSINLGDVTLEAVGDGGGSTGSGGRGGDGRGGMATLTAAGGLSANLGSLSLITAGLSGGGTSNDETHITGDAFGGTVNVSVDTDAIVQSDSFILLDANGYAAFGENRGSSTGGNIVVQAMSSGVISALSDFTSEANAGQTGFSQSGAVGSSTAGNIDFIADGGTISGGSFFAYASAETGNATGAGGDAQGGSVDLLASNGGAITVTDTSGLNEIFAGALSGTSAGGTNATGGAIQLIADGGLIEFVADAAFSAGGTTGGDVNSGTAPSLGLGGSILIQLLDNAASTINFNGVFADANGRSDVLDEGSAFFGGGGSANGTGGTLNVDVQGGSLSANSASFSADGFGGNVGGSGGTGQGGMATFTQTGGAVGIASFSLSASGEGGTSFTTAPGGTGIGGTATLNLFGGTFDAQDISVAAQGFGAFGIFGEDITSSQTIAGDGGNGIGGSATINLIGDAVVTAQNVTATGSAFGGEGGGFSSFVGTIGDTGNGGDATGGTAEINVVSGTLNTGDLTADASGMGGLSNDFFDSSSSGSPTGVGIGGSGGTGQGGTATINLITPVNSGGTVRVVSVGSGGFGASNSVGGNGGDGFGGTAQVIVDDFDAGALAVTLDSSARGGNGGVGQNGAGGDGGSATGGTSRVQANGPNSSITVTDANFTTGAVGGNGGSAFLNFGNFPANGPDGGDGGNGTGGTLEVVSVEGSVTLGLGRTGNSDLSSSGTGGNGGAGANNNGITGLRGGNGGNGGNGIGGDVNLLAIGGSISSGGVAVTIGSSGTEGSGASPGSGISVTNMGVTTGGNGSFGVTGFTQGGRITISSEDTTAGIGQIDLGDTTIGASGDFAGHVNIVNSSAGTGISFASLDATVFGAPFTSVPPSPLDSGIRFASTDGQIFVGGDATLNSDGQIRFDMDGDGHLFVDGSLNAFSGRLITATHSNQVNFNPGVLADGDIIFDSGGDITSDQDSQFSAGGDINFNASQNIDIAAASAGNNTSLVSSGSTNASAASAGGDVYVEGGSVGVGFASSGSNTTFFATGSDAFFGTIDSGSSTMIDAFGSVFGGDINAGVDVTISAGGGGQIDSIFAGDDIRVNFGGDLSVGTMGADGFGFDDEGDGANIDILAGATVINHAEAADNFTANVASFLTGPETIITGGNIMVFAAGSIDGVFRAGGDILLNAGGNVTASATATGGYLDPNDDEFEGNVFVDAVGNVAMTDSLAAQMFGVNAGGSAALTNVDAGEDILVIAGTTASLTNVSAGDDVDVFANGLITASGVFATGEGDDSRTLLYDIDPTGFLIDAGEGSSTTNGADLNIDSLNGALNLTDLEAGDDINLSARTTLAVNGARTEGLGATGGDSSIFTSSGGDTTIADIDAFDDVFVDSGGNLDVTGVAMAGRDIAIEGDTITFAALFTPGNNPIDALDAGRDLTVNGNGEIMGGGAAAGRDFSMAGASILIDRATSGGELSLSGINGVTASDVDSGGETTLLADQGDIMINGLMSQGPVSAIGDSIAISGNNNLTFSDLTTDVGGAMVSTSGSLTITDAMVAGSAILETSGGDINIIQMTANIVDLESGRDITLGTVTATNDLFAEANRTLTVNNGVTAQNISVGSSDIIFGPNGRLGTAGSTAIVDVRNTNPDNQTFVGGAGIRDGYHIDSAEMARLFGDDITIFAPRVDNTNSGSVGSAAPPDVIIDDFTLTAGQSTANLGATGTLTISTPGKARVIGDAALTGMSDANAFNLFADDALEVILGQGTIRLTGSGNTPGGMLNLQSDDVIIATTAAITDVGAATTTNAIDARLAMNDGITSDEGALFANGINVSVVGGFYVQNSGTGTDFAQRRGLTFGALGLNVNTEDASTRIVINGVQLGPNGQVTGLETIPLLTINSGEGSSTGGSTSSAFDPLSTLNGCLIANPASCVVIFTPEIESRFPVQDVIEKNDEGEGEDGDGFTLANPLITIRDIDPLSGEPLLDDPVTGAGNDDLWTPPAE